MYSLYNIAHTEIYFQRWMQDDPEIVAASRDSMEESPPSNYSWSPIDTKDCTSSINVSPINATIDRELLHEEPSLKVSDMEMKGRVLSKAVDDLAKKVRLWRPPKPTKPPKTEEKTDEDGEKKEEGDDAEKAAEGAEDTEKSEEEKVEETAEEEKTEEKTEDSAGEDGEPDPTAAPTEDTVTHDSGEL